MQFDRDYISPYFVTNADKLGSRWTTRMLINEKKLSGVRNSAVLERWCTPVSRW